MSVTAKDHRRFVEGQQAEKEPRKLLEQVAVKTETGDPHLDKLSRAVQALKEKDEQHLKVVAEKGIGCVQEEMIRLQQFEYFYTKGRVDFANKVLDIPSEILFEAQATAPAGNA